MSGSRTHRAPFPPGPSSATDAQAGHAHARARLRAMRASSSQFAVWAILEAIEHLVQTGFVPERGLFLAFGHDEEIGGQEGTGVGVWPPSARETPRAASRTSSMGLTTGDGTDSGPRRWRGGESRGAPTGPAAHGAQYFPGVCAGRRLAHAATCGAASWLGLNVTGRREDVMCVACVGARQACQSCKESWCRASYGHWPCQDSPRKGTSRCS